MNNKILARVVAAVMAVAMLGTLSFAATNTYTDITVPDINSGAVKTVMAVATAENTWPATVESKDIVAVQQIDASGSYPTDIDVDGTRIEGTDKYIIVRFGGANDAAVASNDAVISLSKVPEANITSLTVLPTIKLGDTTYTNVITATYSVPLNATYSIDKFGIRIGKFTSAVTEAEGVITNGATYGNSAVAEFNETAGGTIVTGDGGTLTYTAIVWGVENAEALTDGTTDEDLKAYGYAIYKDATPAS